MLFNFFFFFLFTYLLMSSCYLMGGFFFDLVFMKFFNINFSFSFEFLSVYLFYSLVVLMVFSYVYMFCLDYFGYSVDKIFLIAFFMFLISMEMLVMSSNFFSLLISWDGLGITSYFLVSYYMDSTSLDSGFVTFMFNRLGDSFLIVSVSVFILMSNSFCFMYFYSGGLFYYLFFMGLLTKSAQFPFISWLPVAMSAPTPVSSLVHSSTLVTAGIFIILKISYMFEFLNDFIGVISLLTMFLGSVMAISSLDLKKLVAYSTLSQMGFIFFSCFLGNSFISLFHMVVHAFFKSTIFIMVGFSMMNFHLIQDVRILMSKPNSTSLMFYLFIFSCYNLMGLPFGVGWLSSDSVVELMESGNFWFFMGIIFWLTCTLTICYSYNLLFYYLLEDSLVGGGNFNNFFSFYPLLGVFFIFPFSLFFYDFFLFNNVISMYSNLINLLIFGFSFLFIFCPWFLLFNMSFSTFGLNYYLFFLISYFINYFICCKNFIYMLGNFFLYNFLLSFLNLGSIFLLYFNFDFILLSFMLFVLFSYHFWE